MKLVFNTQSLRPPMTGIGNYTFHLLEQYLESSAIDELHCFNGTQWLSGEAQLAATMSLRADGGDVSERIADRIVAGLRRAAVRVPGAKPLYSKLMDRRFSDIANRIPGAIYHETNYTLRPYVGPRVTTVHDFSYKTHADFHPPNVIAWLEAKLPETIRTADCIITDSELVRGELLHHFDIPEHKVRKVYLGVDECYKPRNADQTETALSSFGLSHGQYVLLTATLEPRKGIATLLDAWCLLPESLRREFPLVLTGSRGWHNERVLNKLAGLVAEGTVHHLGYVPSEVLPLLFSGAAIFTYPSVYEGFGLPVLEAMSSGVPVICRDGTAMAEFAEGSCVLCNTGEAEELSGILEMLLSDASLRQQWSERGLLQAAKFSWRRCAAETIDVYTQISRATVPGSNF